MRSPGFGRHVRAHWRAAVAACIVVGASIAVTLVVRNGVATVGPGALRIATLNAQVEPDGQYVDVSVDVRNISNTIQRGKVWWELSSPQDTPAWKFPRYSSAELPLTLGAGRDTVMTWREDASLPAGSYLFNAWVHVGTPQTGYQPSDGSGLGSLLLYANPHLYRHGPPGDVQIVSVTARGQTDSNPVALWVDVTVRNRADHQVTVGWGLDASADPGSRYDPWWSGVPGGTDPVTLQAGETRQVSMPWTRILPQKLSRLRVVALEGTAPADEVLLASSPGLEPGPGDGTLQRYQDPGGPVIIEGVTTPDQWAEGRPATVTLTLRNVTPLAQAVQGWWVLGRIGDHQPWKDAVFSVQPPLATTLAPWQTTHVAVSAVPIGRAGLQELSVYLRAGAGGQPVHDSDAVFVTSPISLSYPISDVARSGDPSGPVMIESVSTVAPAIAQGAPLTVNVDLRNTSAQPVTARVWWILGPVGSATPWTKAATTADPPVEVAVPAGGGATAVVTSAPVGVPGTYELSFYARTLGANGKAVDSDRVHLAAVTQLDAWDASETRTGPPWGPLVVESVQSPGTWPQAMPTSTTVVVRNRTATPQRGLVWWVLGTPGDPTPWVHPATALDPPAEVDVPPYAALPVSLTKPAVGMPGTYGLSVYIRALNAGGQPVDSDRVTAAAPVHLGAFDASELRDKAPTGPLVIQSVANMATWAQGVSSSVTLSVRNTATVSTQGEAWWILGTPGDPTPWNNAAAYLDPPVTFSVAPGSSITVTLPATVVAAPGGYQLSIYVRTRQPDGSFHDSDAVDSATPVTLLPFDASIRRAFLPWGPVMIEAISAPTTWPAGQTATVSVRLRNVTANPVQAQAWFILGPPGSQTPWVGAAYVLQPPVVNTVPAHSSVTVAMPWTVSAPQGTWEVSAWVRWNNPADGQYDNSDRAWYTSPIKVS